MGDRRGRGGAADRARGTGRCDRVPGRMGTVRDPVGRIGLESAWCGKPGRRVRRGSVISEALEEQFEHPSSLLPVGTARRHGDRLVGRDQIGLTG